MSRSNKAAAIRKFFADHPNATAKEAAKAVKCKVAYVYVVRAGQKNKSQPTPGQQILRDYITQEDRKLMDTIAELEKTITSLRDELKSTYSVIHYLEHRLEKMRHGASV